MRTEWFFATDGWLLQLWLLPRVRPWRIDRGGSPVRVLAGPIQLRVYRIE